MYSYLRCLLQTARQDDRQGSQIALVQIFDDISATRPPLSPLEIQKPLYTRAPLMAKGQDERSPLLHNGDVNGHRDEDVEVNIH